MKILVVGCTHAGTAAIVNLKETYPDSEITVYEKNNNISFLSCGIALNVGKVAGAGIDVFEEEPTNNKELVNHPNVSVTPHIGASTKEAQKRIGEEVITTIINYFSSDISSINAKTIESI